MRKTLLGASIGLALSSVNAFADCSDYFNVDISPADFPVSYDFVDAFNANASATGHLFSSGEFDMPVIIVEGFDVDNSYDCQALSLAIEAQGNLITMLNQQGKDVVLVNFDNTLVGIENNAMVLRNVIDRVNSMKVGNHSNALIGMSMGGLVSRYALTHMEYTNDKHETRLFISFDSPQKYATLPTGMMGVMPFLDGADDSNTLTNIFDSLSVKQMLATRPFYTKADVVDTNYNDVGEVYIDTRDYNQELMDKLESIGNYPTKLHKVAFSNGGAHGVSSSYDFSLGDPLLTITGDFGDINSFVIDVQGISSYNTSQDCIRRESERAALNVSLGYISPANEGVVGLGCVLAPYFSTGVVGENPVETDVIFENLPGSHSRIFENVLEAVHGAVQNAPPEGRLDVEFTINEPEFSFIPTVSSLDIQSSAKTFMFWGHPYALAYTPFDDVFVPSTGVNESHLEITDEKLGQLLTVLDDHHGEMTDNVIRAPKAYYLRTSSRYRKRCKSSTLFFRDVPNNPTTHFELMASPSPWLPDEQWITKRQMAADSSDVSIRLKNAAFVGVRACNNSECSSISKVWHQPVEDLKSYCSGTI